MKNKCDLNCPKLKWLFRLLVFAQFLIGGFLVLYLTSAFSNLLTGSISLAGILLGIWAIVTMGRSMNISPALKQQAELKTTGPYRFVRHPMYTALLVFCGGFVIADKSFFGLTLWLALFFVLAMKIYYEEMALHDRFESYKEYAGVTRRLIPFVF